jgi:hypothetical protein
MPHHQMVDNVVYGQSQQAQLGPNLKYGAAAAQAAAHVAVCKHKVAVAQVHMPAKLFVLFRDKHILFVQADHHAVLGLAVV